VQPLTEVQPQSGAVTTAVIEPCLSPEDPYEQPHAESPAQPEVIPATTPQFCDAHLARVNVQVPAYKLGLCKRCYEGRPIIRKTETMVHPPGTVYPFLSRCTRGSRQT
jgi:hypothetical protein